MNPDTLHNEEQCILEEWRATLKKLIKIQGELCRVRERLNEYYGQFDAKEKGGDQ
jgi:tRNA1(Val) A37 N6-methylase TrmN6